MTTLFKYYTYDEWWAIRNFNWAPSRNSNANIHNTHKNSAFLTPRTSTQDTNNSRVSNYRKYNSFITRNKQKLSKAVAIPKPKRSMRGIAEILVILKWPWPYSPNPSLRRYTLLKLCGSIRVQSSLDGSSSLYIQMQLSLKNKKTGNLLKKYKKKKKKKTGNQA